MAAQKHLHELLQEDQEPFLLNDYISDRRSLLKRPSPKTTFQLKKRKSNHQISNFPANICKNACFHSFPETPDFRKSPLFEFASPVKSPCRSPNAIFLHVPSKTAAILLEAALRIQKQSSKPKSQNKNNGFGLFGSLFKRLTQRKQNRKKQIEGNGVKDVLEWDSSLLRGKLSNGSRKRQEKTKSEKSEKAKNIPDISSCEVGFRCSYNGRPSSVVWSETNEDKSLDTETSSSSQSYESQEIDCVSTQQGDLDSACCENEFCESPFRFVLLSSPSSGRQTPELTSPASSPTRRITEDKEKSGSENLSKFQSGEEEEEEKEQNSPVCVLDPPFDDDDDVGHENDDGFDLDCSFAIVKRAQQQLLYRLRRFEKLAELDPIELEKRMLDQEEEDEETYYIEEDDDTKTWDREKDLEDRRQIPEDLKRLVSDLIREEERELNSSEDREMVTKRICERLELWEKVECTTIDMMIEHDFCREDFGGWKKNVEEKRELARELELSIFGYLVEEFSQELVC